jgi:DDE superfamily endonuclease
VLQSAFSKESAEHVQYPPKVLQWPNFGSKSAYFPGPCQPNFSAQNTLPKNTKVNLPIHTAKLTRNWMKLQGLELLQWPAQSPDLNPIENIWKILKGNIRHRYPLPWTREELKAALVEEWNKLDAAVFTNITNSMSTRITEVIANKGYAYSYYSQTSLNARPLELAEGVHLEKVCI